MCAEINTQSITRKLSSGIQPLAERVMTLVLHLIQASAKTSTVLEDAFLVVGTLASCRIHQHLRKFRSLTSHPALEQGFAPFVNAFLPFLHPALQAHEDSQLCTVAVGLIGDITRALGEQSAQYAGAFMSVLLQNLQSDVLNRNVKISVLSCFGDIALAIGPAFEPYLDTAMGVLLQAGRVEPNPVSYGVCWFSADVETLFASWTTT
jgi:importin subunit beta-1